jgi:hypothetical protein
MRYSDAAFVLRSLRRTTWMWSSRAVLVAFVAMDAP